jgi:ABC-2 type transporter
LELAAVAREVENQPETIVAAALSHRHVQLPHRLHHQLVGELQRLFRRLDQHLSAVRRVGHATGSPVRREALVAGRILKEAVVVVIQSLIIVALALIVGASFPGGVGGVAVLFAGSALLGAMFGALSNGFALIMRQEEALIGATQFILLPLTFLSTTFLAANLIPKWMGHVANFTRSTGPWWRAAWRCRPTPTGD